MQSSTINLDSHFESNHVVVWSVSPWILYFHLHFQGHFIPISLRNVLPISLFSFMVLCFIFKALGHLDFILAYSRRECSNFIHLLVAVQLSQHHLVKRLSFLRCMFLLPLLIDCGWVSLFLFFKLIIIILWKDTLRLYKYPITHQFFTFWHPLIILAWIDDNGA